MMARRPVLVCFDGSAQSEHGLHVAAGLLAPADVVVLAVWQSVATMLAEGGGFGVVAVREHESLDAAVIVTGSRGRGPLKSALLGSVSREVLHHSTRPVLVVPPQDGREEGR